MSDSEDPSSMETAPRSPRIETELVFPGVGDPSASSVSGSVGGIKLQSSSSPEDWGQHQGSRFGLDIGGTLTKLIFFDSTKRPSWCDGKISDFIRGKRELGERAFLDEPVELRIGDISGTFYFMIFPTRDLENWIIDFVKDAGFDHGIESIYTAGGGAWKHAQKFQESLGVTLKPVDELGVVVRGISFMVARSDEQLYVCENTSFAASEPLTKRYFSRMPVAGHPSKIVLKTPLQDGSCDEEPLFPFLLCNIGTGVSIVVVNGENDFTRVSGTAIGGGTFWGLTQLLTKVDNFDEAMQLASTGSAQRLHLLVKDIYGGDYNLQGGGKLPGTLTASFFGKPLQADNSPCHSASDDDAAICRGLITMIAQNVVQIAWLNAKLRRVPRVVFTGNFLRHNSIAMRVIAHNMLLMNGSFMPPTAEDVGNVKAMFLRHEGYFGAMGSFLNNIPEQSSQTPVAVAERSSISFERQPTDFSTSPLLRVPAVVSPEKNPSVNESVRLATLRNQGRDDFELPSPEVSPTANTAKVASLSGNQSNPSE